jgi:hypothetical protein
MLACLIDLSKQLNQFIPLGHTSEDNKNMKVGEVPAEYAQGPQNMAQGGNTRL